MRISGVEVRHNFGSVAKLSCWQPGRFFISAFVAFPADQVQQFTQSAIVDFGVQNLGDFVLLFSVNLNRWRRWLNTVGDGIGWGRL